MKHKLEIEKNTYERIKYGELNFIITEKYPNYQKDDEVELKCYEFPYMDRPIFAKIGYVTTDRQKEQMCVFSLLDVRVVKNG